MLNKKNAPDGLYGFVPKLLFLIVLAGTPSFAADTLQIKDKVEDIKTESKKSARVARKKIRKATGTNSKMKDAKDSLNDTKDDLENKANKLDNRIKK